jgi:hypothetical protein
MRGDSTSIHVYTSLQLGECSFFTDAGVLIANPRHCPAAGVVEQITARAKFLAASHSLRLFDILAAKLLDEGV